MYVTLYKFKGERFPCFRIYRKCKENASFVSYAIKKTIKLSKKKHWKYMNSCVGISWHVIEGNCLFVCLSCYCGKLNSERLNSR